MKANRLISGIFTTALVITVLCAGNPNNLFAQERETKHGTPEWSETHADEAMRWYQDYTNPSHDPEAAARRLKGFAEYRRMTNAPAMKVASSAAWVPVGTSQSANSPNAGTVSGRGTCLAIANDGTMYYGAAEGGIWKSTDNGQNWTSMSMKWSTQAVGGVAVDPNNSNIVYAGTGEYGTRLSDAGSEYDVAGPGILKTTDGGLNWTTVWADPGLVSEMMAINPANSNLVYLACFQGVVMSSDAGATWAITFPSSGKKTGVVIDPIDPSVLYASNSTVITKSIDSGKTWRVLSGGYHTGSTISLGISANNHLRIYAMIDIGSGTEIDSTQDSGATWHRAFFAKRDSTLDVIGYGGLWANSITVNPANADQVIAGGINAYRFDFGNGGFEDSTAYFTAHTNPKFILHDVHVLKYDRHGTLFAITDGGLFHSSDNGAGWGQEMNNTLGTLQFVGGDMYPDPGSGNPTYFVAGAQDNGLNKILPTQKVWQQTHDGDGGRMFIDQNSGQTVYGTYTGTVIYQSSDAGVTWSDDLSTGTALALDGAPFYMEYDVSNANSDDVALCGNRNLWYSPNGLASITALAGPKSSQSLANAQPQCAQFSADGTLLFLGTRAPAVYFSVVGGLSWIKSSFKSGIPSCFTTDPSDPSFVFMTTKTNGSGYGGSFFFSIDSGKTWQSPSDTSLPKNLNYYSVAATYGGEVFVGSDYGVLVSYDTGHHWAPVAPQSFPAVQVTSMHLRSHYLVVTTYGRGMYSIDINSLGGVASNGSTPSAVSISAIYPNPVSSSNGHSSVRFSVVEDARVSMSVYDVLGREERVLMNQWTPKGDHETSVDLANLPAGQHYISLTAVGTTVTQAITIE